MADVSPQHFAADSTRSGTLLAVYVNNGVRFTIFRRSCNQSGRSSALSDALIELRLRLGRPYQLFGYTTLFAYPSLLVSRFGCHCLIVPAAIYLLHAMPMHTGGHLSPEAIRLVFFHNVKTFGGNAPELSIRLLHREHTTALESRIFRTSALMMDFKRANGTLVHHSQLPNSRFSRCSITSRSGFVLDYIAAVEAARNVTPVLSQRV